jgi:hypothetical protein
VTVDATRKPAALPVVELRFPPLYAWLLVGIGVAFAVLGLFLRLTTTHAPGLAVFIAVCGVAGAAGGNYWRHHLHCVARLTPRQLYLQREGTIDWTNIAAIEKKQLKTTYRGVRNTSEFVCITLKKKRPVNDRLTGFMHNLKSTITGYDIIVPDTELSCTADWFLAECRKRMDAASGSA